MAFPEQEKTYTYADYLTWDESERWDIIDGIPYMQATPSRRHQEILGNIYLQIGNYLKDKSCKAYMAPFCVRLDLDDNNNMVKNVIEPDITIICDKSKLDDKGCKGTPDMIIEILSPSSAKIDKLIKFNKYETAGVKEYWIVEPNENLISVFIIQPNGKYGRPDIYSEADKIKVSIFDNLEIDLNSIFSE